MSLNKETQPESKRQSMGGKHTDSPEKKKLSEVMCPKMNVITRPEFEITFSDVAV